MNEKYYILYYPSSWGMGSSVDTRLVSDTDIRRLIRTELDKKEKNNQFDDRFTGTWNEEQFCDSSDIEEVIGDVIHKRLTTCSTYAGVNDLILVPEDVPVIREDSEIKDTIFRVCNQFDCITDVIVGEGVFRRCILDLRNSEKLGDLEGGWCYDFLGYDLKQVLTTGLWFDRDTLINNRKKAIDNLKKYYLKKDGTPRKKCTEDDILFCREDMETSRLIIEKFEAVKPTDDKYNSYFYRSSAGNSFIDEIIQKESLTNDKRDYTLMAYENPVEFPEFGQIWHKKNDGRSYFTYSELFKNGDSVEWLTASLIKNFESPEERGEILPFYALVPVFAGD